ncbi:MAG: glycoside hydrolase family 3 protein [Ignavibacteriaceae bacterium]
MKKLFLHCFIVLFVFNYISCNVNDTNSPSDDIDFKIGQMLMVGFKGYEVNSRSSVTDDINKFNIGGVVLYDYDVPTQRFERNIQSVQQVGKLTNALKSNSSLPLLIAIDQEGGRVNRLKTNYGFPASVSAQYLGSLNNIDSTRKYAALTASTLAAAGININLAPVVDLNTNPDNPVIGRIGRSFSSDPSVVAVHSAEIINVHHQYNVLTTLKHFPGHGSSRTDSHLGFTDVTDTWQEIELEPYRTLINSGKCDLIMTAHIFNSKLDADFPATLSKNIITGILRNQLNFNGVVISDDMQMKAISDHYGLETAIYRAIDAGVDILLFANNSIYDEQISGKAISIIKKLILEGKISRERIEQSFLRISKLKFKIYSGS